MPAAIVAGETERRRPPATAAITLDTLCAPIRGDRSARGPTGVARAIRVPSHVISISSG